MIKKSNHLQDIGLLVLRVAISAPMMVHGWAKFLKLVGGGEIHFADPIGIGEVPTLVLAVLGELVAPLLIIIGFKTKLSAIPAAITMAVAFFVVHAPAPFEEKELAFLYLIAFTAIALLGGGKFSVDGLSKKKR